MHNKKNTVANKERGAQCSFGWRRTLTLVQKKKTHTVAILYTEFLMVNPCTGEALHDTHMGVHMGGGGHMFGLQMSYFEATVPPHPLTHPRSLDNHTRQNSCRMSRVCQVHRHRPHSHTHTHMFVCVCVCSLYLWMCGYIYIHTCMPSLCIYHAKRSSSKIKINFVLCFLLVDVGEIALAPQINFSKSRHFRDEK